jgi:hypothetical protein
LNRFHSRLEILWVCRGWIVMGQVEEQPQVLRLPSLRFGRSG